MRVPFEESEAQQQFRKNTEAVAEFVSEFRKAIEEQQRQIEHLTRELQAVFDRLEETRHLTGCDGE